MEGVWKRTLATTEAKVKKREGILLKREESLKEVWFSGSKRAEKNPGAKGDVREKVARIFDLFVSFLLISD